MKFIPRLIPLLVAAPVIASAQWTAEAGAGYFRPENAHLESSPTPLTLDEPSRLAPYVAATYGFTPRFGLRMSYQFVNNARATAQFGSPPGSQPPVLPIVVWGHYHDDIHVVSAAPEFTWPLAPQLTIGIAPQLNWVASRGRVSYSTDYPLILLVAPRDRNEDGLTLGGSVRVRWALGPRASAVAGYQYIDIEPSFDRTAHVFSGGLQWKF